ncbi:hypothetical protein [Kutzneria sp. 744]|uniref:hypothetical protein n=1 Tax=Kutzneria sp. (strain 744) TaxID=345341 RepID=UPI0004BC5FDD|nr:hypothetical protein [Kutzneria sp. 744]
MFSTSHLLRHGELPANGFAERVVRTVRSEVTGRLPIQGERHLRIVLDRCLSHDKATPSPRP